MGHFRWKGQLPDSADDLGRTPVVPRYFCRNAIDEDLPFPVAKVRAYYGNLGTDRALIR